MSLNYQTYMHRWILEITETQKQPSRKTEAVIWRCSAKKVFQKISQNSRENTCARVSFLIKLQACNFIKNETVA